MVAQITTFDQSAGQAQEAYVWGGAASTWTRWSRCFNWSHGDQLGQASSRRDRSLWTNYVPSSVYSTYGFVDLDWGQLGVSVNINDYFYNEALPGPVHLPVRNSD